MWRTHPSRCGAPNLTVANKTVTSENDYWRAINVCPNCHAMPHRHPDRPCSVEELRRLMGEAVSACTAGT